MKNTDQRFLSTQELGLLLGVTRQTIRNWINKGEIRAFHIGQNFKISVKEASRILMSYGLPVPDWFGRDLTKPLEHSKGQGIRYGQAGQLGQGNPRTTRI